MVKNLLSIDFESWCYLPEFILLSEDNRKKIDRGYVLDAQKLILNLLEKYDVKLTFFVLGELFEWYPEMIEEIEEAGHEIAYHSHRHEFLISNEILAKSFNESKKFIKKFKPKGFRAPNIFMKEEYLKILKQNGLKYDSSIYSAKTFENINGITEIPVSTYSYFNESNIKFPTSLKFKDLLTSIPFGSGYFFGVFQSKISFFIDKFNKKNKPATLFVHNWQILKPQTVSFPNVKYLLTHPSYLPYTFNINKTFEHLLKNFEFYTFKEFVEEAQ